MFRLGTILSCYIEDLLIFSGLFFIACATFMVSETAGYYSLGVSLLGLGVYFTRNPLGKG